MKKIITVTVALILMLTLVSCAKSEEEVAAEEAFNAEVARIQAELEERDADVEAAQAVVDDERPALDETLKPALQTAISEASAIEFDAPKASGGVEDINSATEELKKITYTDQLQSLKDATKALSDSIKKYELVNAPEESYVIKCLNKMSKEDGEFERLRNNYELSINKAISPHSIQELPCSFVDAQDYKIGIKDGDHELVDYSHFQDLISRLNYFISQKGYLGKLDAPIMVLKASIDEVTEMISDNDADRSYLAVLSRLEKKVDQHRNQISIQAHNIIRRGLSKITNYGDELSRKVGVEKVKCTDNDIEELIANTCQDINQKLESLCSTGIEQLNEEIDEVTSSDAFSYFFKSVEGEYTEKGHIFENRQSKINRAKVDSVRNILETISGKTISLTTKAGTTVTNTMFKISDVTGSQLHEAVLAIGKQFGYKFKPWEAAKITKNIGNAAKMIGALMSIVGLAMDVKETADEIEQDEKIRKQRLETRQVFVNIASDLETKYSEELSRMFNVYDEISNQISNDRDKVQQLVKSSSIMSERLYGYKKDLIAIQGDIF